MSKEINNEVMEIKHMAFAVEDIKQSLRYYKDFLGVSKEIVSWRKPYTHPNALAVSSKTSCGTG